MEGMVYLEKILLEVFSAMSVRVKLEVGKQLASDIRWRVSDGQWWTAGERSTERASCDRFFNYT